MKFLPAIYVVNDDLGSCLTMLLNEIFVDPCYDMVFESALDHLVEEIWREELMDVGARKIVSERLENCTSVTFKRTSAQKLTVTSLLIPKLSHTVRGSNVDMMKSVLISV